MYKFYNNNPLKNNVSDCATRAISLAEGESWDYTYKKLSNLARMNGQMMDNVDFIEDYLDERYERINDIPKKVGEVAGAYPNNVLLITMNGHITCSKYGVIYDSFDCRERIAEYCWKVK